VFAALGAALAAAYFLRLLRQVTQGPATSVVTTTGPWRPAGIELVSWAPLVLLALAIGLVPALVTGLSGW
jgi:NADH-quinone oxidoreductase subunit M